MLETFGVYVRNILQPCPKVFLANVSHSLKENFQNVDNNLDEFVEICVSIQH